MRKAFAWSLVAALLFGSLVATFSPAFARVIPWNTNDRTIRSCPAEDMILKPIDYHGLSTDGVSTYRCVPADRYIKNHS